MKICFVTGSRAEYGLLNPLMKLIKKDKKFSFQLFVTGMHLSKKFGNTYKEIIKDKFKIKSYLDLKIKNDKPHDICKSIALGVNLFSKKFEIFEPDLVVLLGDRYEIFAACTSALIHQIPVCHIHGGELTRGAFDDSMRHSISKMSHIHLVANKIYADRVKQMGENPKNIYVVGGFGVDVIKNIKFLNRTKLQKKIKFKFGKKNLLVTFHPVTLEKNTSKKHFSEILKTLDEIKDVKIIFTKTNSDTYGNVINKMIDAYVKKNKSRACSFNSMGQLNYLSTLKIVDGVVGNSSSGLSEAPALKVGTINIGDRQKDRLQASSVIDTKPIKTDIEKSIKMLYSQEFQEKIKKTKNPYGYGGAFLKSFSIKSPLFFKLNL